MNEQFVIIFSPEFADYLEEIQTYDAPIAWSNAEKGEIIFNSLEEAKKVFNVLKREFPTIDYIIYKIIKLEA